MDEQGTLPRLHVLVEDRPVGDDDGLRHGHRFRQCCEAAALGAIRVVSAPNRQNHAVGAGIEVAELAEGEAVSSLDVPWQVETADVAILADDHEFRGKLGGRSRERPVVAGEVLADGEDEPVLACVVTPGPEEAVVDAEEHGVDAIRLDRHPLEQPGPLDLAEAHDGISAPQRPQQDPAPCAPAAVEERRQRKIEQHDPRSPPQARRRR